MCAEFCCVIFIRPNMFTCQQLGAAEVLVSLKFTDCFCCFYFHIKSTFLLDSSLEKNNVKKKKPPKYQMSCLFKIIQRQAKSRVFFLSGLSNLQLNNTVYFLVSQVSQSCQESKLYMRKNQSKVYHNNVFLLNTKFHTHSPRYLKSLASCRKC